MYTRRETHVHREPTHVRAARDACTCRARCVYMPHEMCVHAARCVYMPAVLAVAAFAPA